MTEEKKTSELLDEYDATEAGEARDKLRNEIFKRQPFDELVAAIEEVAAGLQRLDRLFAVHEHGKKGDPVVSLKPEPEQSTG
jgi:hypothetical protein